MIKKVAMLVFWLSVIVGLGALLTLGPAAVKEYKAKKAVAQAMKDPDSVKFRNIKLIGDTVCGEINGKNSYGAYGGFHRFSYANDTKSLGFEDEEMVGSRSIHKTLYDISGCSSYFNSL